MAFAFSLVVKATLVLVVGLTAARVFRRARASVRHVVLAATFGALFAMPLYEAFGPTPWVVVPIDVPIVRDFVPVQRTTSSGTTDTMLPAAAPRAASGGVGVSLGVAILGAWAIGAALLIGSLLLALSRLSRLTRSALPWLDARPLASTLAQEVGLRHPVDILVHEDVDVPLTWGLRRPVIVLPTDAREWSDVNLRHALLHEMEHVYRNDWMAQLMARMVRALYWFHPLVWLAMRKLSLEAERACDDAVIRTADRTAYADQLVSLAQRLKGASRHAVPAMASRSDLSTRVRALLDEQQRRGRVRTLPHAAVIAAMSMTVFAIGPVRAVESTPVARLAPELHDAPWAPAVRALLGGSRDQSSLTRPRGRSRLGLALIEAAGDGDIDGINALIAEGVDVNSTVHGDGSPLIVAAREGHVGAVRVLIDRGADVDMGVPGDGNPLIMAAKEGHAEIVDLLLSRGATIDKVVDGDENALISASGAGRLAAVRVLVSRGADVNARVWARQGADPATGEWRTPLNMAIRGRHTAVAEFLRSAGAQD